MRLDSEFYQLPLCFDTERLAQEVRQFNESDWRPHPQGYPGNSAIGLITVLGDPNTDAVKGPMQPSPHLERCPYLQQVLASFRTVLGRTRLMRISAKGEATAHVDTNYYWLQRVRIHIPIVTFPEVQFVCGGKSIHMAAGECWLFDTWRMHNVLNPTEQDRIHLVCDTVGNARFWDLVTQAKTPFAEQQDMPARPKQLRFHKDAKPTLSLESVNYPVVMSPWEQESLLVPIIQDLSQTETDFTAIELLLERFHQDWRELWTEHGEQPGGWEAFRERINQLHSTLKRFEGKWRLPNGMEAIEVIRQAVIRPALNTELANPDKIRSESATVKTSTTVSSTIVTNEKKTFEKETEPGQPTQVSAAFFDRPIIIVAAPRSGSTLLFETLSRSPDVWTIGGESHGVFESLPQLHPKQHNYPSNRLTEEHADDETVAQIRANFRCLLRNREGQPPTQGATSLRLLEKTPKNALRIPFLNAVFPNARFVYLFRDPAFKKGIRRAFFGVLSTPGNPGGL